MSELLSSLCVAAVNYEPVYGDIEANLARLAVHIERLAAQGVELLLFPEMCLTGYGRDALTASLAQPAPGELTDRLLQIARRCGIAFIAGMPEQDVDGGAPYVSQMLFTPEGRCDIYRKIHLHRREAHTYRPGTEASVWRWRGLSIGMQLCYDTHFPELSAYQASAGAQLLCMSFATPMGDSDELLARWKRYLPARAYDNTCCVLACNQAGISPTGAVYAGAALALDPQGRVLSECSGVQQTLIYPFTEDLLQQADDKRFLPYRRLQGKGPSVRIVEKEVAR